MISGDQSSHSVGGTSDVSYISGLSNVSYLSNNKSGTLSDNSQVQGPNDVSENDLEDIVGSESYISPEMITTRQYSYASDLWALGVIIYQILSASLPFKGKTQEATFEKIKTGQYEMPLDIGEDAKDLISKLIVL